MKKKKVRTPARKPARARRKKTTAAPVVEAVAPKPLEELAEQVTKLGEALIELQHPTERPRLRELLLAREPSLGELEELARRLRDLRRELHALGAL